MSGSVSIKTDFTVFTVDSFSVIEALEAFASVRITASWQLRINVVVALTRLTCSAWNQWIAKEVVGTAIAVHTYSEEKHLI